VRHGRAAEAPRQYAMLSAPLITRERRAPRRRLAAAARHAILQRRYTVFSPLQGYARLLERHDVGAAAGSLRYYVTV